MITEQRQMQCIVWDGGFKQIFICQTDICLESNREKEAVRHHFQSILPPFIQNDLFNTYTYTLGFRYVQHV